MLHSKRKTKAFYVVKYRLLEMIYEQQCSLDSYNSSTPYFGHCAPLIYSLWLAAARLGKKVGHFCAFLFTFNGSKWLENNFLVSKPDGDNFRFEEWYFVIRIVLTYCEKKIGLVIEKNFWNSTLKAENLQKFWDH